ncbi:hypothetical protein KV097_13085 [Mumia sp. zg.B17]|uniref:hypothetical protein n=1 Tax=Mumia sp. zg.B17 TaxID=2855446 RepID=UPI001C6EC74B|nr:hypothetical protein [Mumia sp. zg.B17]MBW9206877.1 hypothetical protein [Mumia sp. zg.B17]
MSAHTRTGALMAMSAAGALVASLMTVAPASAQGASPDERTAGSDARQATTHIVRGLDNVRQISFTASGRLLVSEAGHGRWGRGACRPGGTSDADCIGRTGRIRSMTAAGTKRRTVASRLPSNRTAFETFAAGVAGVDRRPGGSVYATFSTYAPGKYAGKVVRVTKRGKLSVVARPRFDGRRADPGDVVALRRQVLVLDNLSKTVLRLRNGRMRTWYRAPRPAGAPNAPVVNALSHGADGRVYAVIAEDSSTNAPTRVVRLNAAGRVLRTWVTPRPVSEATATSDGVVWVDEIEGPIRRVDGAGPSFAVPSSGSLAARGTRLYATAYAWNTRRSYPPGSPAGQVWRLTP